MGPKQDIPALGLLIDESLTVLPSKGLLCQLATDLATTCADPL